MMEFGALCFATSALIALWLIVSILTDIRSELRSQRKME